MRLKPLRRTALLIFAAAGLLALAMWIAIASALRSSEREALARADTQGRNLAHSMAEHLASSVRAIDLVLMHLRSDWVASTLPFADSVAQQQANLRRENVAQLIVTDADGRIAFSSLPGFQGSDVSGRPYFKGHKDLGQRELQIGAPAREALLKQLTIAFTRPIYDRQERFAGVLALFIPPPTLARVYEDIELGEGASITLVRADGQILARSHDLAKTAGISLISAPGLGADVAPSGGYRRTARTDGVERIYRYQKIPGYPLTIFVGQALDTVLAPYRAQRTSYLSAGVLASVLLLLVALLLALRVREKEAARGNREQLQADLRKQIAHLQLVYDTSSAAIFDVDTEGIITHANRCMAEMFGYSQASLVGSAYTDYLHADERESGKAAMFALIEGRTNALDRERHYRRKDGSEFWGRITGRRILDAGGKVVGLVGVIVDITDAKQAAEALRRKEAHLRELLDAFPIAVAHIDKTERLTYANRIYCAIFGDNYYGRSLRDYAGETAYAVLEPYIRRALAGETVDIEREIVSKDGEVRAGTLRYFPDRDARGEVCGYFSLREDITARRRAEEQIRKLNEDLELRVHERTAQLSAAITALQAEVRERQAAEAEALSLAERVQNMTRRLGEAQEVERRRLAAELHDGVGSNLAAIGLNLALLQKQLPQGDIAGMQRQLADLIVLIDQAKANAKEISVDLRPLLLENRNLFPALEEYARIFEDGTGIPVHVTGDNTGARLPAETKIALFRIAQEALTNCAKHARASAVEIEFNCRADHLQLSVADDGVGIDVAGIAASNPGLGLLSMQERAEAIGGRWQIESTPGRGTRVSVRVGAALGPH